MTGALAAILLAALPAAPSAAQDAARDYTLEDAERAARNNSSALQSAAQDVVIAQQRVTEARFLFLPEVGMQASASRYEARYPFTLAPEFRNILLFPSDRDYIYSGRGYLIHTLYSGGRTSHLLRLARTALKQARTQYEAVQLDIAVAVHGVFCQALAAQESLRAVQESLRAAEDIARQGFAGWERVSAEGALAELRARQARAAHRLDMATLEFRRALNIELDTPVLLTGALETRQTDVDLDKAIVWAMDLRPELQAETYKAQIDDIGVSLAQSRRIPTVILESNYEVTGQRFPLKQNNWDATVGIRLPISFDFQAQIREKRAEKRQGEIKRADIQDRVRLEVRRAWEQFRFWQAEWPRREGDLARLKALAEAARSGNRGIEAVRAQLARLDATERHIEAVQEHLLALARLERAVGRALAR